jgi:phospho-N-acetylmuramoyl-pentapeptide-transferase
LLQSYAVLIVLSLYAGFFVTLKFLPFFFKFLPSDRGREFTLTAEAAKGKPTGAGVVFITFFVCLTLVFAPLDGLQLCLLALTWLMMLTGYLDDSSKSSWGEYKKALLDLFISLAASAALAFFTAQSNGTLSLWFPFISGTINVPVWIYIAAGTVLLWASVNTTNCTDGVDGLSSTLVLAALITMGAIFYIVLGHKDIASYLLVPHLASGASWAVMTFCLAGVLMGYLWHNAHPSRVLMGDAGSRALGFYIGVCCMVTGNPFLIFVTSTVIFINGGLGLLKVALKRFFHISIFKNTRFPLHDEMRKKYGWSPAQIQIKFLMLQLLVSLALLGIFFKIR